MANTIMIPSMFEYRMYRKMTNSNISYKEYLENKEQLELKAKEVGKVMQQTILNKISKNITLTPDEYEYKVKWDERLKPTDFSQSNSSSSSSSSSDTWMWVVWWMILGSLFF